MNKIDLTGKQFGRFTVLSESPNSKKRIKWLCKCSCGTEKEIEPHNLKSGGTKSCGCLHKEGGHKKHNLSKHRLYTVWCNIKLRCYNKKHLGFQNYGGRGITVFWKNDFKGFYDYVIKLDNYGETGRTLDRINNDGNYEPNNLKWATHNEQSRNKRDNLKFNGEIASDAGKRLGGSHTLINNRLKLGWSMEDAFTIPVKRLGSRPYTHLTNIIKEIK